MNNYKKILCIILTVLLFETMLSSYIFAVANNLPSEGTVFSVRDTANAIDASLKDKPAYVAWVWSNLDYSNLSWKPQVFHSGSWHDANKGSGKSANKGYDLTSSTWSTPELGLWVDSITEVINLIPQNGDYSATMNSKSAISFITPEDGLYTFSADDTLSATLQKFVQVNNPIPVASSNPDIFKAGVRITINNTKIWPETSEWYVLPNKGSAVDIPTLNCELNKNDILRVEAISMQAGSGYYCNFSITAGVKITYKGLVPNDTTAPVFGIGSIIATPEVLSLPIQFPSANDDYTKKGDIRYDIYVSKTPLNNQVPSSEPYRTLFGKTTATISTTLDNLNSGTDYYLAIVASDESSNNSQIFSEKFKTQELQPNTSFSSVALADKIIGEIQTDYETKELVDVYLPWYPSFSSASGGFYNNATKGTLYNYWGGIALYKDSLEQSVWIDKAVAKKGVFWLVPNSGADYRNGAKNTASLTFKAPDDGLYTFGPDSVEQNFTNTKNSWTDYTKPSKAGVRIMLNGFKIWPADKEWAEFDDNTTTIPMPTIENCRLLKGELLRVEAVSIETSPFGARSTAITASAKMTYKGKIPLDLKAPVFESVPITSVKDIYSIGVTFPTATDNNTVKERITYSVYISNSPFTDTIPSEEPIFYFVGGTGVLASNVSKLYPDTSYYFAIVAKDESNNFSILKSEPVKTLKLPKNTKFSSKDYRDRVIAEASVKTAGQVGFVDINLSSYGWKSQVYYLSSWHDANMVKSLLPRGYALSNSKWATEVIGVWTDSKEDNDLLIVPCTDKDYRSVLNNAAALTFVAPVEGAYKFGPSSSGLSKFINTDRTNPNSAKPGVKVGLRITINDEKIWPKDKEWQELDAKGSSVDIPEINFDLAKDSVFRIETVSMSENPDWQEILAGITFSGEIEFIKSKDMIGPVFEDGLVVSNEVTENSIKLFWPKAHDNITLDNNIKYEIFYSKLRMIQLPKENGTMVKNVNSLKISKLDGGTNYYFLVVAIDEFNNKTILRGGPTKTKGNPTPDAIVEDTFIPPNYPYPSNMGENDCGIVSSSSRSVTISWIPQITLEKQRIFAFTYINNKFLLVYNSGALGSDKNSYTIDNLGTGVKYIIQIVGYNVQGDATAIYPYLIFKTAKAGIAVNDTDNPGKPGKDPKPGNDDKAETPKPNIKIINVLASIPVIYLLIPIAVGLLLFGIGVLLPPILYKRKRKIAS
jgi:hypothetical protein